MQCPQIVPLLFMRGRFDLQMLEHQRQQTKRPGKYYDLWAQESFPPSREGGPRGAN